MKSLLILTVAALLPASSFADLNQGLVANYTFEGNENNSAGAGLNLTGYSVGYQNSLFGQAASFNGTSSYMQTPDMFPIVGTSSRSISVWLNADSFWGYRNILQWGTWSTPTSAGTSWAFYLLEPQQGRPYVSAHWIDFSTPSNPDSYAAGQWVNLAVTYDGAARTAAFYLNGTYLAGTVVVGDPANINTASGPLTVGNVNLTQTPYSQAWNAPWDGLMDNLRIYDRVLTSDEIAQLAVIPEPSTLSLLLLIPVAVAVLRNKRNGAGKPA